jgi:hypothetical protein
MKQLWPEFKVSQSVQRLATGWAAGKLGFDFRKEQEIFVFSKATKPISYPADNGAKATGA